MSRANASSFGLRRGALLVAVLGWAVGCAINPIPSPVTDVTSSGGGGQSSIDLGDVARAGAPDGSEATDVPPPGPHPDAATDTSDVELPCPAPLDDDTLQRLVIDLNGTLQLRPGDERALAVGTMECCVYFEPAAACVAWSVEPVDAGATIDSVSGLLTIAAETAHGAAFVVTADVEDGRRRLQIDVFVYTSEGNPLVGLWTEADRLSCDRDGELGLPAEGGIGELVFRADGRFAVTWFPFEVYQDYWGSYTFDGVTGGLVLTVEGGNYVPPDVDGEGTFSLPETGGQGGERSLVLDAIWLGTGASETDTVRACGHRFRTY